MSMPEDIIAEREHAIRKLHDREQRAVARIRRALRTLEDVRTKLARARREIKEASLRILAEGSRWKD